MARQKGSTFKISEDAKEKIRKAKFTSVQKECMHCGRQMFVQLNILKRGNGKFCSNVCNYAARKGKPSWNKGKKASLQTRQKISFANKKRFENPENHPLWKKDRNSLVKSDYKHLDGRYREWMLSVKKRDNFTCRIADNNCDGGLEAHHILPWRDFVELRYKINNGITLCHAHHPRKRAEEKRLIPTFQELVSVSK